jgi:hypothetical protein
MAGNTVAITIAGDSRPAEDAFRRVGDSADTMGRRVADDGFGRASEAADSVDTKAMGFRDTLTGIQDGAEGIKRAAAGDWGFETLLLLGFGLGDLASGLVNFLIPAMKGFTTAVRANTVAMLMSPVTWIVLAIIALIAVIVLIAVKTDWFSRAWSASWKWIKSSALNVWNWLKQVPGWIGSAFAKVAKFITAPFRTAFNYVADAWNNTVGRLSFTFPGWIPGIGGNSISVPNIPKFHSGGVMPGAPGSEGLAILQAGERVQTRGGDAGGWVPVRFEQAALEALLIETIQRGMGRRGGRAVALGIQVLR